MKTVRLLTPIKVFSNLLEEADTLLADVYYFFEETKSEIIRIGELYQLQEDSEKLVELIDNRFKETARHELISSCFCLTPYDRKYFLDLEEKYLEYVIEPRKPKSLQLPEIYEILKTKKMKIMKRIRNQKIIRKLMKKKTHWMNWKH